MERLSHFPRLSALFLALATLQSVIPEATGAANSVTIESVTIAANQLRLHGDFGTGAVTVLFASNSVPVISSSATDIVAALNPVPGIGTYRVDLRVDNKAATAYGSVSPKILQGFVHFDGSVDSGSGFTVVHPFSGHYRVSFPAGTFQIGSPYLFPVMGIQPLFSTIPVNINSYFINGDQSGHFEVDFAGSDTTFGFTLIQTY